MRCCGSACLRPNVRAQLKFPSFMLSWLDFSLSVFFFENLLSTLIHLILFMAHFFASNWESKKTILLLVLLLNFNISTSTSFQCAGARSSLSRVRVSQKKKPSSRLQWRRKEFREAARKRAHIVMMSNYSSDRTVERLLRVCDCC